MIGLKDGAVTLESHSQEWGKIALVTINKLKSLLGDIVVDIQHVGSTSINGLMAKPIIDIEVGVSSIQNVMRLLPLLEENGYYYRPNTSNKEHVLFACRDLSNNKDTHYIHVVIYGNSEWNNNIKFRDILNKDSEIRKMYEDLKLKLALKYPEDRTSYTNNKSEFIQNVLNS